jgi:hypothetical protein
VLLYLLPGLTVAAGALVALLSAGRVTAALVALTAVVVLLGFGVPVLMDLLRGSYLRHAADSRRGLREAGHRAAQVRDHFGPAASGILPWQVRGGSYFTGRVRVLSELAGWLGQPDSGDGRARVVTGGPGSGKSAVLGRLVCLADLRMRGELVPWAPPPTVP